MQHRHITDLPDLDQPHSSRWSARVTGWMQEPWRVRLADETRPDSQPQLVGEASGEKRGMQPPPTLDHELSHPACAEIIENSPEIDNVSQYDDFCKIGESRRDPASPCRCRVHSGLLVDPLMPEFRPRIEITAGGHGNFPGICRFARRHPSGATRRILHDQSRIVTADRFGTDQYRIRISAQSIDTIEIGGVGKQQTLLTGVVEISIDAGRHRENDTRPTHTNTSHCLAFS